MKRAFVRTTVSAVVGLVLLPLAHAEHGFGTGAATQSTTADVQQYDSSQPTTNSQPGLLGVGGQPGSGPASQSRQNKNQSGWTFEAFQTGGRPELSTSEADKGMPMSRTKFYGNGVARIDVSGKDGGGTVTNLAVSVNGGYEMFGTGAKPVAGSGKSVTVGGVFGVEPANISGQTSSDVVNDVKLSYARKFAEANGYNPDSPQVQAYYKNYGIRPETPTAKPDHFVLWTPMVSGGVEVQTKACRLLALFGMGPGLQASLQGDSTIALAYRAALEGDCKYFNAAFNATRLAAPSGPEDLAQADVRANLPLPGFLSDIGMKLGLGIRAETIVTHDSYKNVSFVPTPVGTSDHDRIERRGQVTATVVF